jgi:transposase
MKRPRTYATVVKRWYRPAEHECPVCHRTLRQAMTLTRRTVVTLEGVIKLIHAGYRCPDRQCPGSQRTYRNAAAEALALPGFTYGLDIVLLVGQLHLGKHQTVDEVHEELLRRLAPVEVRISRREILYLFEAYSTLLRASSEVKADQPWLAQVEQNGGIIVSIDGIQPDKGNETIYLVRDALTGRVLTAEQVTSSETAVMQALLAPVVALGLPVLGTITDAHESEVQAVTHLWPEVPHQVCQFHALREASRPAFEADRAVKTTMRKESS